MKSNKKARRSDNLHDDECMEILLQLPVKSVIRFKSVSKQWFSLISTPYFRRLHTLRRHKPPSSLIIASRNSKFLYFNPSDTANPTKMIPLTIYRPNYCPKILSSCNGLLLIFNYITEYEDVHVYNPATRQSRKLALFHDKNRSTCVVCLHLVFDPSVSLHYKIVCIRAGRLKIDDMPKYYMEVFDSESGKWNVRKEPFTNDTDEMQGDVLNSDPAPLFFSNIIFGMSSNYPQPIYCFDIDRNMLSFLAHPTTANHLQQGNPRHLQQGEPRSEMLQVSNDCLYYISVKSDCVSAELWELQLQRDDPCRSLWLLKHQLTVDPPPQYTRLWRPNLLRFIMETSTLLIYAYGCIVAYNFLDKSCNELLGDQSEESSHLSSDYFYEFYHSTSHVHQFAETLALL